MGIPHTCLDCMKGIMFSKTQREWSGIIKCKIYYHTCPTLKHCHVLKQNAIHTCTYIYIVMYEECWCFKFTILLQAHTHHKWNHFNSILYLSTVLLSESYDIELGTRNTTDIILGPRQHFIFPSYIVLILQLNRW